jgi:uncharacterized protein (DUF302 family)
MQYYIQKTLSIPFDAALQRIKESLGKEGFGVLTEIDMRETLKKKLNVDFRNYRILGACNPPFAWQALQVEDKIGLLLPCNVIVQETADGKVEAAAIDPVASMERVDNSRLAAIAQQVKTKLINVMATL